MMGWESQNKHFFLDAHPSVGAGYARDHGYNRGHSPLLPYEFDDTALLSPK